MVDVGESNGPQQKVSLLRLTVGTRLDSEAGLDLSLHYGA